MKTRELSTGRGLLQYESTGDHIKITGYRGRESELAIPGEIENLPVTVIGKKAFLSNKTIRRITLPDRLEQIEDWAFAHCAKLEQVEMPYSRMEVGQGVFKECHSLRQIVDKFQAEQEKSREDISYLLAATIVKLDAFYLFDLESVGEESWIRRWDERALTLMKADDAEGFSKMLLCGEEDYGSRENDLGYYMEQQRRAKVRLAILRLMHDYLLAQPVRDKLTDYLLAHTKGKESEETWRVVLEEHGDERAYYQFLIDCGCVTEENFKDIIEDMGGEHTEMKAFLMHSHAQIRQGEDAFAAFTL